MCGEREGSFTPALTPRQPQQTDFICVCLQDYLHCVCVCARLPQLVRVGKVSDRLVLNSRPVQGLNFGQPSFATPSLDRFGS